VIISPSYESYCLLTIAIIYQTNRHLELRNCRFWMILFCHRFELILNCLGNNRKIQSLMISNGRVPDKILYLGVQKFDFLFQLNYLEFLFKRLLPCLFLLNLKRHFLLLKDLLQTFDVFFMNAFLRFNFVFLLL
jgi:hypothetical protein